MILSVNNLSFKYQAHPVLEKVSFTVKRGEILAILGPNGVGKTTLLKCINQILTADSGSVTVGGFPVSQMGVQEIARLISYVPQKAETSRVTVFDAVLMGRRPHMGFKFSRGDLVKTDGVIRLLDMEHIALKHINHLSGGELQKVSIARALVQETGLMLLDEPTASLDLKNQAEILGLLRRVAKEHNVSMVLTMHDLNAALRYSDKYIFLKDKMVYDSGPVSRVSQEMVEAVYGTAVEIIHHNGYPVILPGPVYQAA
ncbi:MAG: ABC transporter ATP-binding protein [Desulfobacteraceae bacterium]|nr:MAG: ABC transporter ATP-binding protein [Desulfobacteraceae bacterium]